METTILVSVGGVVLLVWLYWLLRRPREDYAELDDYMQRQWRQIDTDLASTAEADWRRAVVAADNVLDYFLRYKGFGGSSLGERLKMAQGKYHRLREVWPAHLLRNRLVHENDVRLVRGEAKRAVATFAQALAHLGYKNLKS